MNKISAEEVVESLQFLGVKAIRKAYYKNNCACGLGAIYAKSIGYEAASSQSVSFMLNKFDETYGYKYIDGFIGGFDGNDVWSTNSEEFKRGHADGKAAWVAVVEKGLVGES